MLSTGIKLGRHQKLDVSNSNKTTQVSNPATVLPLWCSVPNPSAESLGETASDSKPFLFPSGAPGAEGGVKDSNDPSMPFDSVGQARRSPLAYGVPSPSSTSSDEYPSAKGGQERCCTGESPTMSASLPGFQHIGASPGETGALQQPSGLPSADNPLPKSGIAQQQMDEWQFALSPNVLSNLPARDFMNKYSQQETTQNKLFDVPDSNQSSICMQPKPQSHGMSTNIISVGNNSDRNNQPQAATSYQTKPDNTASEVESVELLADLSPSEPMMKTEVTHLPSTLQGKTSDWVKLEETSDSFAMMDCDFDLNVSNPSPDMKQKQTRRDSFCLPTEMEHKTSNPDMKKKTTNPISEPKSPGKHFLSDSEDDETSQQQRRAKMSTSRDVYCHEPEDNNPFIYIDQTYFKKVTKRLQTGCQLGEVLSEESEAVLRRTSQPVQKFERVLITMEVTQAYEELTILFQTLCTSKPQIDATDEVIKYH